MENAEPILENSEGTVKFTSKWMLIQLKLHLNPYVEHKCIHKKIGTFLYKNASCM